ncbi:unnamed protein product [Owenia fusiformis]|uniref:protein-histidine N-methyltransferase n=1 Tax=Owenia fusiformis TaxID=6347 RepID=A0A8S4PHB4_OWEFU|nr:unnamed protein product [Owenia fusiformis]
MGKKNRKARASATETEGSFTKTQKRDMMVLVHQLLDKCRRPPSTSAGKLWEEHMEIREIVEKLRKMQEGFTLNHYNRADHFKGFMTWVEQHGVDTSNVEVYNFPETGYGLRATKDIPMDSPFLTVPRKLMMTVASAKDSIIGPFVEQDQILQAMPNVVIALHLLCERLLPSAFWEPYIKILPDCFSTPLYFTTEDMKELKGSPALNDAMSQYRNIARQYAYFFKEFQTSSEAMKLPMKNSFCFDDYRWAVSAVMTRQNQIPTPDGEQVTNALIPLWDMSNHSNGQITTDFNLKKNSSECYALRNFSKADQIFIFYGRRSNAEFLLHSGFIPSDNQSDRIGIKLGISKNDSLYVMKAEMLARVGLMPSRGFALHVGTGTERFGGIDPDLLAFLRIFHLNEDELKARLVGKKARVLLPKLGHCDSPVNKDNEVKVWTFLENRVNLLLKAYPGTMQDDADKLKSDKLSFNQKEAVKLRMNERIILENTVNYAKKQKVAAETNIKEDYSLDAEVDETMLSEFNQVHGDPLDAMLAQNGCTDTCCDHQYPVSLEQARKAVPQNISDISDISLAQPATIETVHSNVYMGTDPRNVNTEQIKNNMDNKENECEKPKDNLEHTKGAVVLTEVKQEKNDSKKVGSVSNGVVKCDTLGNGSDIKHGSDIKNGNDIKSPT